MVKIPSSPNINKNRLARFLGDSKMIIKRNNIWHRFEFVNKKLRDFSFAGNEGKVIVLNRSTACIILIITQRLP